MTLKGADMLSIRLPENLEDDLNLLAEREKTTKTEIVKNALSFYMESLKSKKRETAYELGAELFGRYGSGDGELSSTYKTKLKEILREKHNHR
jgi:predicted DNA-binding protein